MPFPVEEEYCTYYSKNSGYYCGPLSGTCIACSTLSSSCLHTNQHLMGSTVDECSGEASSGNAISYSVNVSIPVSKTRTGHLVSGSSSNTSENVYCEASCRNNSDLLSAASETVSVFPKPDDFEVQGDAPKDNHQSCITKVSDSQSLQFSLSIGDGKGSSSFPLSANALLAQENVSIGSFQTSSECLDVRSNFDQGQRNYRGQRSKSKENLKELKDSVFSVAALSSQSASFCEAPSDTGGHTIDRLNADGNNLLPVVIDKLPSSDHSVEIAQEHLSPHLHGENVNSLLGGMSSVNNHSDNAMEIVEKNEVGDNTDTCLTNVKESSLESHSLDECDDSDLVEHDVKVCDICGDAGREDLLAICCRCIDGAEHTYCMREMLDKVPLGDWLCEECKLYAEMNGRDLEIVGSVDGIEKTRSSGPVDPESLDVYKKFETGVSDVDQKNNYINFPSAKILGKRQSNDSQVSSPAKRHALEPENVSGNKSITNGEPAISRNSSMKLDRLKTKTDHSSNSPISAPESADLASASRLQAQGTFAKSNSFNSLNVKSKVNLLDDVIPQKQRSTRESVSSDRKEGISRSMSKSMSFKTPYGARANIGESKVKMLSPKFSHLQDTKGSKNSKDCKVFERKNSFQLERSSLANSGSHAAKNDRKIVSSGETNSLNPPRKFRDAKAVTSDRRSTILSKSPSFATRKGLEPVSLGEVKRQSTTGLVGISSAKVPKPNQDNLKVDTSSSNCSAELSSCYANEGSLDDLSQQIESTDSDERAKDGLSSRLREGVDSKDKLKAAIEAAMLRKPGIYQKHRQPSHCSDVSAVSAASKCETAASHVLMSGASNMENVSLSFEEKKMILGSSTSDFYKRETLDDAKQIALVTCEASTSSAEESPPFGPLEGLSLAIPDNDYIWNGAFEVQRVGRNISLFDGIQAHLSASASPKVLEAVNKFNNKVVLNEVPRLKTWPVQFQENGVGEDNIAIFFFAKDSASYEKSYKGLLNNMMKNDVALKGNFGGFELMIFPSNQLPEKCQRWNTMFFMWGVFRGKRVNQRQVPGSDEKTNAPQDVIMASMTSPVNISLGMPIDIETRALGLTSLSSSEALRGLSDCRLSSDIMDKGPLQTDNVLSDSRQNLRPFSVLHPSVAKSCVEKADISRDLSRSSISLQEQKCCIGSDDKKEPEVEIRVESAIRDCDLNESPQKLMNYHPDFNQQQLSSAAGSHEMSSAGDRISLDGASLEGNLADGASPGTGNQMVDDKFTEVASEPASLIGPGTATGDVDLEEVRIAKKQKTDCYGGLYGENGGQTSTSKDSVLHSDCLSLANGVDEISSGSYFFPVQPKEEVGQVRRLMQSSPKIIDLEEDIAPNLELALGAESKTSPALPFLVEKDDKKFTWHLSSTPEQTATTKGRRGEEEENDVVSASLSLSLSFPFPEKEEETTEKKPSLGSEAGNVNTSLLLFGLEGQVENRIPSSLQYPGGNTAASQACNRFK